MKHAVLIMAHKNVDQLKRLIKSVASDDFDVFVHLDKKMSVADEEIRNITEISKNIFILKNRISASLDTWSLVNIALSLISLAKETENSKKCHYSYYLLLSGQDYPIKSNEYILDYLNKSYPKPMIDCTPYDKSNWIYHKFKVVGIHGVRNYINSNLPRGIVRKLIKLPIHVWGRIQARLYKSIFSYGYKLYGGSQWWILPDQVIEFIINEMQSNSKEIKKLTKTMTPDETFFQIMTMASPLSNLVEINPIDMVAQNCMTYANFSVEGKPFTGHPYIFTKDDFNKLIEMPQLFARKFDINTDSEIIDMIDEYINQSLTKEIS